MNELQGLLSLTFSASKIHGRQSGQMRDMFSVLGRGMG